MKNITVSQLPVSIMQKRGFILNMKKKKTVLKKHKSLMIAIGLLFVLVLGIGSILLFSDRATTKNPSPENHATHPPTSSDKISLDNELDLDLETETEEPEATDVPETTTEYETALEPETDENGNVISDMDFTLPDEELEEPETTQPVFNYPYLVKVNRLLNCVTVYTKDENNEFTIPYKSMACSTGKYINNTPLGTFRTSNKYTWRLMVDGTQSQFATRVYGGILFHSVPCYWNSKDQLEVAEFNKLGGPASLGCIRLTVEDSKWLYDNCPSGTTVIIYDDASSPGPLGKPEVIKIPEDHPYAGWDPTDPDASNPWHTCTPAINVIDVKVSAGTDKNIFQGVTATDTCGNDISDKVVFGGEYDLNTPGTYTIDCSVTDLLGRSATATFTLTVKEKKDASEKETTKITEKETTKKHEKETTKKSEKETTKKSEKETTKESQKETTKNTETETTKDSQKETTKKAEVETTKKSEKETTKKPEAETTKESEKETTKKPEAETTKKPQTETSQTSETQTSNKPEKETTKKSEKETSRKPQKKTTSKTEDIDELTNTNKTTEQETTQPPI